MTASPEPRKRRATGKEQDMELAGRDSLFTVVLEATLPLPFNSTLHDELERCAKRHGSGMFPLGEFVYHRVRDHVFEVVLWRVHTLRRKPAPGVGEVVMDVGSVHRIMTTCTEKMRSWRHSLDAASRASRWVDALSERDIVLRVETIHCRAPA